MTPGEIDGVLADFRGWLTRVSPILAAAPPMTESESVDLTTLVRHFTALRQEVNLQTRASRSLGEQNGQALATLSRAVEELHGFAAAAPETARDPIEIERPLLKSLLEIRDALALAHKQVSKSREPVAAMPALTLPPRLPFWSRWLDLAGVIRAAVAPIEAWAAARAADDRALIESLLVGYTMSLQRIDRTLSRHGLERIECVGRAFDPETMEVVEVVKDSSKTASEVLEEVRPGYLYRGQLFRCAQVRVARP